MADLRTWNVAAKMALAALMVHIALFPDLPQYAGKGIGYRIALYPLSAVVVPLVWRLGRGRRRPEVRYPHHIDLCVVAPFLIDTAGNAANLYDTLSWWDDLMHFVTWVPLVMAIGLALRYLPLGRLNVAALTIGGGAVVHIFWEVAEYLTFVQGNPDEARTAYEDTIGDLTMSLLGSITGAVLVATVLWNVVGPHDRPGSDRPGPQSARPQSAQR